MHRERVKGFEVALEEAGFVAAIILQRRDLFYLTGTAQPCNFLVIPGHEPILFARRAVDWVRAEAHVDRIEEGAGYGPIREAVVSAGLRNGAIGMELDAIPAALYQKAADTFVPFSVEDCSPLLLGQRMVKEPGEVEQIRAAGRLFEQAHRAMLEHLRPGIRENELAGEVASAVRRGGHEGHVFYRRWDAWLQPEGLLVSGDNLWRISGHVMGVTGVGMSPALPWGASSRRIERGDVVILDIGLNVGGYHADVARTYTLGRPAPRHRELFDAMLECQLACVEALRPGRSAADVYRAGLAVVEQRGLRQWFQGYGAQQGEYVGHGLGLELDEPPTLWPKEETEILENMVLSLEPKVISPEFGAVDVEDNFVVRSDGAERLTTVERELFAIEV